METHSIQSKLEALLFISGEPVSYARLSALLKLEIPVLKTALRTLAEYYATEKNSGLMLIEQGEKVEMATKPALAPLVERFTQATLQEILSKASLEVLSIVAYRAPIARHEIEAIRGVNCSYTLRALLIRGLIERAGNPADARGYVYRPTFRLLEQLGLSRPEDLPDYQTLSTDERMSVLASPRDSGTETDESHSI